jgi:hypothetical protein
MKLDRSQSSGLATNPRFTGLRCMVRNFSTVFKPE